MVFFVAFLKVLISFSFFDIPVFRFQGEAIGAYDIVFVAFCIYLILNPKITFQLIEIQINIALPCFFLILFLSMRIIFFHTTYSVLLTLKSLEMVFQLLVVLSAILRINKIQLREIVEFTTFIIMALAIFQLSSWFHVFSGFGIPDGLGFGNWSRVGLPFMDGFSSNPAGAVLGISFIFMSGRKYTKKLYYFGLPLVALAGFLTLSRTNIFAIMAIMAISISLRLIKNPPLLVIGAIVIISSYAGIYNFAISTPESSPLRYILNIVIDPTIITKIGSFRARYQGLWLTASNLWQYDVFTLIFGNGIGFMPVVDSLYYRLLVDTGIIGFIFFANAWIITPLINGWKSIRLRYFFLFMAINGINAETLVVSFRATQIFVILLCIMLAEAKFIDLTESNRKNEIASKQESLVLDII